MTFTAASTAADGCRDGRVDRVGAAREQLPQQLRAVVEGHVVAGDLLEDEEDADHDQGAPYATRPWVDVLVVPVGGGDPRRGVALEQGGLTRPTIRDAVEHLVASWCCGRRDLMNKAW